jgi:hypothetical protein
MVDGKEGFRRMAMGGFMNGLLNQDRSPVQFSDSFDAQSDAGRVHFTLMRWHRQVDNSEGEGFLPGYNYSSPTIAELCYILESSQLRVLYLDTLEIYMPLVITPLSSRTSYSGV